MSSGCAGWRAQLSDTWPGVGWRKCTAVLVWWGTPGGGFRHSALVLPPHTILVSGGNEREGNIRDLSSSPNWHNRHMLPLRGLTTSKFRQTICPTVWILSSKLNALFPEGRKKKGFLQDKFFSHLFKHGRNNAFSMENLTDSKIPSWSLHLINITQNTKQEKREALPRGSLKEPFLQQFATAAALGSMCCVPMFSPL